MNLDKKMPENRESKNEIWQDESGSNLNQSQYDSTNVTAKSSDDEEDEEEKEERTSDWGNVDPQTDNSPFPDPNAPTAPGSAV